MKERDLYSLGIGLLGIFTGLALGHAAFSNTPEVMKLRSELLQTRTECDELRNASLRTAVSIPPAQAGFDRSADPAPSAQSAGLPRGLSKEDLEESRAMDERRSRGEYFLGDEDPIIRKIGETNRTTSVARIAELKRMELGVLFAQFGLSDEASQQLQSHRVKITQAALKVEADISQLQTARNDYDSRLRTQLSAEDYSKYRLYEDTNPARAEYAKVLTFASQMGLAIDPNYEDKVVNLLYQAKAYTSMPGFGPYEGTPQPAIGLEAATAHVRQQLAQLTECAAQLSAHAAEAGLPDAAKNVVDNYYATKIKSLSNVLALYQNPKAQQDLIAQEIQRAFEATPNQAATHP